MYCVMLASAPSLRYKLTSPTRVIEIRENDVVGTGMHIIIITHAWALLNLPCIETRAMVYF